MSKVQKKQQNCIPKYDPDTETQRLLIAGGET
jgi:hypothetical protein